MECPRITVVVPSYNQCLFLGKTLSSIVAQQYPNLELFVFDGGSTDGSTALIREFEAHISFWRSEKDSGQADAIQAGLSRSSGQLLTWLNSDDVLLPGSLTAIAAASKQIPKAEVFYGDHIRIDENDAVLSRHFQIGWHPWLAARTMPYLAQPGTVFRRRLWERVGGLDTTLQCAFDYDLWYRFIGANARFVHIEAPVAGFRIHGSSKGRSRDWSIRYRAEVDEIRRRYTARYSAPGRAVARLIHMGLQTLSGNYLRSVIKS